MINNSKLLLKHLISWLHDYAKNNHIETFVFCKDNTPEHLLLEYLCSKITSIKKYTGNYNIQELAYAAELHNGLILSNINRNQLFSRIYGKYKEGFGDIYPLGDLYHSEILHLLNYLDIKYIDSEFSDKMLTYRDVEWADRENENSGIITSDTEPNKSRTWFRFTLKQKEIISRLHQKQHNTQHKTIFAPVCYVRKLDCLI